MGIPELHVLIRWPFLEQDDTGMQQKMKKQHPPLSELFHIRLHMMADTVLEKSPKLDFVNQPCTTKCLFLHGHVHPHSSGTIQGLLRSHLEGFLNALP